MKLSLSFMVIWWLVMGLLFAAVNHEGGDQIVNRLVFTGALEVFLLVPFTLKGWIRWGA